MDYDFVCVMFVQADRIRAHVECNDVCHNSHDLCHSGELPGGRRCTCSRSSTYLYASV